MAVATFAVLFWFKLPDVSRLFLLLLFPTMFVVALTTRAFLRLAFRTVRSKGMNGRFVLVCGAGPRGQAFAATMESHRELGLRIVGFLDDDPSFAEGARWPWAGQARRHREGAPGARRRRGRHRAALQPMAVHRRPCARR